MKENDRPGGKNVRGRIVTGEKRKHRQPENKRRKQKKRGVNEKRIQSVKAI